MSDQLNPADNRPHSELFRLVSKEWVDADAGARMLEESKSATLARLITEQGDKAVNRAETNVKSSEAWQTYITNMVNARTRASLAKVKMEYYRMKFHEWQSAEASKRAEMRL